MKVVVVIIITWAFLALVAGVAGNAASIFTQSIKEAKK